MPGYQFCTKAKRIIGLDEERDQIKVSQISLSLTPFLDLSFQIHQCIHTKDDHLIIYVDRVSPVRPAAVAPVTAASATLDTHTPQPVTSAPSPPTAATKVRLFWQTLDESNKLEFVEISPDSRASDLRTMITNDEVEVKGEYLFAQQVASNPLPLAAEGTTTISALFAAQGSVILVPASTPPVAAARSRKVTVMLMKGPTAHESIGFLDDVDPNATLEVVRKQRLTADEVEDLPAEYRFLDAENDVIALGKEKTYTLAKCIRKDDKGGEHFCIKAK